MWVKIPIYTGLLLSAFQLLPPFNGVYFFAKKVFSSRLLYQ
ncbi:hypothetical protein CWATWH0005_2624 [Crocosphaera watsonii WH 0005]|uniref:Uncharacterized protein n=1 Tax=Crocosphaera watsonii WH 0005 TaxID=423472 RepID=T2IU54_CROWT|nr:hypothetical protein CWATWH0005_2624 [Crocosphaera watsonii WH 0005]